MSTPQIADPKKNPSYPQRVHLSEKPHWLGILQSVEAKLTDYGVKLTSMNNVANRSAFEKIHAQMLGARDQVAAAVKRIPQECGHLYEEDHHRVDDAVAAFDRLIAKWEAQTNVS